MKKVKLKGLGMEIDVDKVSNPVLKKVLDERVCGSEFQFFSRKSHDDYQARERNRSNSYDRYDDHTDHSEHSKHIDRWGYSERTGTEHEDYTY